MTKRIASSARRPRSRGGEAGPGDLYHARTRHPRRRGQVLLNRPEVHNAFNATLIAELTVLLRELDADAGVRAVVLAGAGTSFCAGADLTLDAADGGVQCDARTWPMPARWPPCSPRSTCCRKPTIARVHGAAFGGGAGLVACCDVAIGTPDVLVRVFRGTAGIDSGHDQPLCRRGDRCAGGTPLLPDRRAIFRRRSVPPRPAA